MITVKASQEIFTYEEVTNLTGICAEHLQNLVRRHHLGFISRAGKTPGNETEQWFFNPSDLAVLVTLFPRCAH
jgi:hypothetical protein